ncbi:MAG: hypothetical protein ACRETF_10840, partial [Nevskiaceae bacterium]
MIRRLAGLLPLLTCGCVSLNSVSSETRFAAPPDPARPCAYAWQTGEVLFRSANVRSFVSGPPAVFGNGAMDAPGRGLVMRCPTHRPARNANVSVYYLQYAHKAYDWLTLPMIAAAGYSGGLVPLPTFRHYVVCLEATSDEGLARYAMARGSIDSLQNVWGAQLDREPLKGSDRVAKMLQDLTSQAWHKLWLLERENLGAEDCQQKLE